MIGNLEGLVEWEGNSESLLCIDQRPGTSGLDAAQLLTSRPRVSGGQEFSSPTLRRQLLRALYVLPSNLFRHLFNMDLLSTYCVPGTALVIGDTRMNKTSWSSLSSGGYGQ